MSWESKVSRSGAVLEAECLVGAGALITEGKRFASGSLIVGSPARVVRQLTDAEVATLVAYLRSHQ